MPPLTIALKVPLQAPLQATLVVVGEITIAVGCVKLIIDVEVQPPALDVITV